MPYLLCCPDVRYKVPNKASRVPRSVTIDANVCGGKEVLLRIDLKDSQ